MSSPEKPILFRYPGSVFSDRVLWYLWLRGIPYDECIQPHVMPRPDLSALSIAYRRMPLMAIGKDILIDSRLIIAHLESLYPDSPLSPTSPSDHGLRALFENFGIDGGLFARCVQLLPYWNPGGFLQDEVFLDDRERLMGMRFTVEGMEKNRPDGVQHLRQVFELFETTFLEDGRRWVLGGEGPSLADLDAGWPLCWLVEDPLMKGALPREMVNEEVYPRTFAWVRRFMGEVERMKGEVGNVGRLEGREVVERVFGAEKVGETEFLEGDALGLSRGDEVEVFPSDYGQAHKDRGAVVGLTTKKIVIRNAKGLHLHFPRWNFRINKIAASIPASVTAAASPKPPKMLLIYHNGSSYTRKVYMHALELGLAERISLQKVVVCPIPIPGWSDNNEEVAVYNPMAKIPCLVPEDVPDGIFDSRIICEYLSSLAPTQETKDKRYWQMRTLHACADGIMDAAVLITYETYIRKKRGLVFDEWIEGQRAKILRGLDRFEVTAGERILKTPVEGKTASVDEIAVAVATAVTESMPYLGVEWREGRPKLVEWMKAWEGRKSFVETTPDKEWGDVDVKSTSDIWDVMRQKL
ncbi:hypothetical protein P280DRAFT_547185 [Massarina eburnea CBS 473.64]|uniref:GST N-terminal domain-containing protein n=1 Tax=Massarina eburnea CBS 473.64 TaxID=1395130 RepID=A0A6A6S5P7_9PLEO|nr:hypothetical protein P280DRAFT_547185 [Massarina eburnea CBS 473.64]